MGATVNTSIESLRASSRVYFSEINLQRSFERLASGIRLSQASEDAAGLGVAENLSAAHRSLKMAMRNAYDGISVIQIAEGAAGEIANLLKRMRELAVQSASDTLANQERGYIAREHQALAAEIDRIAESTEFNGLALTSAVGVIEVQVGIEGSAQSRIDIRFSDLRSTAVDMLVDPANVDLASATGARSALAVLDAALDFVNSTRSGLGASQNQLLSALRQADAYHHSLDGAEGQIRDTDYAVESAEVTKLQIIQQSGVAVLAQAKGIYDSAASLISG